MMRPSTARGPRLRHPPPPLPRAGPAPPPPARPRRPAAGHELDVWDAPLPPPPDELRRRTANADALLCLLTDTVDADLLDHAPDLEAIAVLAVGTDNVDLAACRERDIPVGNTPDVLTEATADLTFALLLAAARRLPEALGAARNGAWR